MSFLTLFLLTLATAAILAMQLAGAYIWAGAAAILGLLGLYLGFWVIPFLFFFIPAIFMALLGMADIRKKLVSKPLMSQLKKIMPTISETERAALEGGTVNWDGELFKGQPDYDELRGISSVKLTDEEQAFIDGPLDAFCSKLNDWKIRAEDKKISKALWQEVSDLGLLGMLISKKYGGLGFSAQAQSIILGRIAARSPDAGVITMVPNSLGPGELIEHFGTETQKDHYLPRLAKGEEIPCFALTGEHSGSDAAAMRDIGVVSKGTFQGEEIIGINLTWKKRYISLGPDATLLGLAFDLVDPNGLLSEDEKTGITLALIPTNHKGVNIGDRHLPSGSAFPNGPTSGRGVFIPFDWVIGGKDQLGKGWAMLMSCLSAGRAISLPASSTACAKQMLRSTSAYALIRRQFGLPIGKMEGIEAPLANLVEAAYVLEAARAMTAAIVSDGGKPAVISALLKYQSTEWARRAVNDAMDIHGGRAICDGPLNYLQGAYQIMPVGITVEGANILTRSLITFSQGALRAHPYLYHELNALETDNLDEFDEALCDHGKFFVSNLFGSLFHNLSRGYFAGAPRKAGKMGRTYQQLSRAASNFAFVADTTIMTLGGGLKRRQKVTGRLADALSELYFISSVIKRFEDDGEIAEHLPLVNYCIKNSLHRFYGQLEAVSRNFPVPGVGLILRLITRPMGNHFHAASDKQGHKIVTPVLDASGYRDDLTRFLHVNEDENDPTGLLEKTLTAVVASKELMRRFEKAIKTGEITRYHGQNWLSAGVEKDVISVEEAQQLEKIEKLIQKTIEVDHFDQSEVAGFIRSKAQRMGKVA